MELQPDATIEGVQPGRDGSSRRRPRIGGRREGADRETRRRGRQTPKRTGPRRSRPRPHKCMSAARALDRALRQADHFRHPHAGGGRASIWRRPFRCRCFPKSNFPRVLVGVDNGVAPIDQMLVTVTRPIEEALNTVQGLERVQSTTSRGSAEINLFFSWKVDMFETLERVNAALASVQGDAAADRQADGQSADVRGVSDHGLQPHVGHGAADHAVGAGHLRPQAPAESDERRVDDRRAGRRGAGVRGPAGSGQAAADVDQRSRRCSTPSAAAI